MHARTWGWVKKGCQVAFKRVGGPSLTATPKCLRVSFLRGCGRCEISLGQQPGSTVDRPIAFGSLDRCCAIPAGDNHWVGERVCFQEKIHLCVYGGVCRGNVRVRYERLNRGNVCAQEKCASVRGNCACAQAAGWNRPPAVYQVWLNGISLRCVVRLWARETLKVALCC